MKIENRIKRHILIDALNGELGKEISLESDDGIEDAWSKAHEYEGVFSAIEITDKITDFRCSGHTTGMEAEYSRHYESDRVAKKLICGTYVSWIYWFGGSRDIDWMCDAFEVNCVEEEKMVTVRTYSAISF